MLLFVFHFDLPMSHFVCGWDQGLDCADGCSEFADQFQNESVLDPLLGALDDVFCGKMEVMDGDGWTQIRETNSELQKRRSCGSFWVYSCIFSLCKVNHWVFSL